MNLELPENLDAFVKAQVRSGRFASEQDVLAEAVRTLKSRLDQADTIEAIRLGIADVDASRTQPWAEALAEIRRDLDSPPGRGQPVHVVDAATKKNYVLIPADEYENVKSYLQGQFDPRDVYPFVDRVMAEDDTNDPTLASYQNLPNRPS